MGWIKRLFSKSAEAYSEPFTVCLHSSPVPELSGIDFESESNPLPERNDCATARARSVWVIQAIEPIRTHSRNPGVGYWRGTRQRELSSKVDLAVQFVRRRDAARVLEALTDDNPEIRERYRVVRVLVADEGSR